MRGLFVTGTDTGVGKTVVAASIVAALRARGERVRPLKPVLSGLDEPALDDWPHDHELLARTGGVDADRVALLRYGPPVSPHLAAELAGAPIDPVALVASVTAVGSASEVVVVEGAGGLLVPLARGFSMRDLARSLGLPLLIAARPGLGTINHTLLTLEAARSAGLRVAAVVLTPWADEPTVVERSNRATIAEVGEVAVAVLPRVARAGVEELAAAGAGLPVEEWVG